jgi:hypothetical protein
MRTAAICVVCAILAFVIMQVAMHTSLFSVAGEADDKVTTEKKAPEPDAVFPEDLAPLARGKAVPRAGTWMKRDTARCAVLAQWTGQLHRWNDSLDPSWKSGAVEETELVIVVSKQTKTLLEVVPYQQGPPVRRYRYDMNAWLVEAKSGQTLTARHFTSIAPTARRYADFALTELGEPVDWPQVEQWVQDEVAQLKTAPSHPPAAAQRDSGLLHQLQERGTRPTGSPPPTTNSRPQ